MQQFKSKFCGLKIGRIRLMVVLVVAPASARDMTIKLFSNPNPEESEDCLYANVWAPKGTAPEGGWPVMFWIYGGNLQIGDSGEYSLVIGSIGA